MFSDLAACHWGTAIEYISGSLEDIRKSSDPAARHWGRVIGYRLEDPEDSHKFWDHEVVHWDIATVYKSDSWRAKRPAFLLSFNVNTLHGLAGDSLSEADSAVAAGAAETTLANQMAASTLKYEVFIVKSEPERNRRRKLYKCLIWNRRNRAALKPVLLVGTAFEL